MAGPVEELAAGSLTESARILHDLAGNPVQIAAAAACLVESVLSGGKILTVGNGGSAADAQHVAAELVGRFRRERKAIAAVALTTDTSVLTSLMNDYGREAVFERQVEALGREGDVLLALSTSGDSANVLCAAETARRLGLKVVGLTGAAGGRLAEACDVVVRVPSSSTPRIQEAHIAICHVLCDVLEQAVAKR